MDCYTASVRFFYLDQRVEAAMFELVRDFVVNILKSIKVYPPCFIFVLLISE